MTAPSKTKSHFNQVLLKIDARSLHENNKKSVSIVSNQDQVKMSLSVKSVVAMNFMCPFIKAPHL